jgi:hypothetical protein
MEREEDGQPRWGAVEIMHADGRRPDVVKNAMVAWRSAVAALRWTAFRRE